MTFMTYDLDLRLRQLTYWPTPTDLRLRHWPTDLRLLTYGLTPTPFDPWTYAYAFDLLTYAYAYAFDLLTYAYA
jgi:hypothetical protein